MAFFDPKQRIVTLRIVYDGLGTAGKTTNINKLYELYTIHRQGPVHTPTGADGESADGISNLRGRTTYFDWLDFAVGTICDRYPLRCQVLSVPGQFTYAPRRWELLRAPDAIVSVCDSSPSGVERGHLALRFLRELRASGVAPGVPLVVQANKRDSVDALSLDVIRTKLEIQADEELLEATATHGDGVRLTFLSALTKARERVQKQIETSGVESLELDSGSPDRLVQELDAALSDEGHEAFAVVERLIP